MIISRTPLRVSLFGGGSDIPSFYNKGLNGEVLNFTIDKYIYVTVNKRFDNKIRVSYSRVEIVENVNQIQHSIIRECLLRVGILTSIEITIVSDFPGGTGMGSSSSLAVGVLNALYRFIHQVKSKSELAEEACDIEISKLVKPIGKQDQYAASYGGLNYFVFSRNKVDVIGLTNEILNLPILSLHLMLVYTGISREADSILAEVSLMPNEVYESIHKQVLISRKMFESLRSTGQIDLQEIISSLNKAWEFKKNLSSSIINEDIEDMINNMFANGAKAIKLLGAGGGGFILAIVDDVKSFKSRLSDYLVFNIKLDFQGSSIVYDGNQTTDMLSNGLW
jgi:D-glycero-alpha-D-manno-heptose-7-phosphate kinase